MRSLLLLFSAGLSAHVHADSQDSCNATAGGSLLQSTHLTSKITQNQTLREDRAALDSENNGRKVFLLDSLAARRTNGAYTRPLFIKTYKCRTLEPHSCEECHKRGPGCFAVRYRKWEGGTKSLRTNAWQNRLKDWKYSRVRVAYRCPPNAHVQFFADLILFGKYSVEHMTVGGIPANKISRRRKRRATHELLNAAFTSTRGKVLEVDLVIKLHPSGVAHIVDMWITTSPTYILCQDHKTCLEELDSSAGLQIRNDNRLQLLCLQNKLRGHLKQECERWRACLRRVGNEDRIRTLILATGVGQRLALAQRPSEAQLEGGEEPEATKAVELVRVPEADQSAAREDSCIDPRLDDPESWLCSCLDNMEQTCLAVSHQFPNSTQRCLTALMCLDPMDQICSQWKQAVKCNGTEYAALKSALSVIITPPSSPPASAQAQLLDRARQEGSGLMQARKLDSAVRGKNSPCD